MRWGRQGSVPRHHQEGQQCGSGARSCGGCWESTQVPLQCRQAGTWLAAMARRCGAVSVERVRGDGWVRVAPETCSSTPASQTEAPFWSGGSCCSGPGLAACSTGPVSSWASLCVLVSEWAQAWTEAGGLLTSTTAQPGAAVQGLPLPGRTAGAPATLPLRGRAPRCSWPGLGPHGSWSCRTFCCFPYLGALEQSPGRQALGSRGLRASLS